MTFIEKVKQTIERVTGCRFYYHAAGELNELLAGVEIGSDPIAFAYLLKGGEVAVGKNCREGVNLAVFFCKKTEFDFNSYENEQLIDDCKRLAFGWVSLLYKSNILDVVGSVTTERVYDTTTDILTGIAVNITLRELDGYGMCDLPYRELEITENGLHEVAGYDAVKVNVTDGAEVDEPEVYSFAMTENGLRKLQRMNSYAVFVNVNVPPIPLIYEELSFDDSRFSNDFFKLVTRKTEKGTYQSGNFSYTDCKGVRHTVGLLLNVNTDITFETSKPCVLTLGTIDQNATISVDGDMNAGWQDYEVVRNIDAGTHTISKGNSTGKNYLIMYVLVEELILE